MGFSTRDSCCGGVGFSAWLCWWWGLWVGVAMVVVDVGGSGYRFLGVGGGGFLGGGLWIVSIVPLFRFVG